MSAAREYRRQVLRMGESSIAREERRPPARDSLDTFIFGSLAVLAVLVVLIAIYSRMA
jgi:hypothetical protein